MTDTESRRGLIVWAIAMVFAFALLAVVLYQVRAVLLIVYVAGLLAIGMSPTVRWLEKRRTPKITRRRMPRWAAILLLYVGIVGFIAIVLSIVIPPFVDQLKSLWSKLPDYADQLQRLLVRYRLITHRYTWSEMLKSMPAPGLAVSGLLGAIKGVLGAIGAGVTVLVLPYYMLLEASDLQKGFLQLLPEGRRSQVARITRNVTIKVGAWLGGQVLLSLVIGTTTAVGLWLLGVPYFYVFALIAGIGEAIPVIGPVLSAIPAILVGFTVSPQTGIFVAIFFGAQQFIENHFLVPRVMQKQVGLSAVTVLVALLLGSELLGIVGALLAVPTAAIVQVLVQEYTAKEES